MSAVLRVKVVPGSSREAIAGRLGDRLKVRVSAPPEAGAANQAVCRLIADALGVRARDVRISAGHTRPEKTLEIDGVDQATADALLGS
ncbi:MAG: DUF167 domain-containing protein [Phycisphaerales bacterium]|nr:DUF167 domain-containing protein [Phycisphaerales bacterium]